MKTRPRTASLLAVSRRASRRLRYHAPCPLLSRRDWLRACARRGRSWCACPRPRHIHERPRQAHRARATQPPWTIGPFTRELRGRPILTPRAETRFMCPVGQPGGELGREGRLQPRRRGAQRPRPPAVSGTGQRRPSGRHVANRARDEPRRSAVRAACHTGALSRQRRAPAVRMGGRLRGSAGGGNGRRPLRPDVHRLRRQDGAPVRSHIDRPGHVDEARARLCEGWRGRYRDLWSKSGAIVCESRGGTSRRARIDGRYWMYWGDTDIFVATSDDLVEWTPLERPPGAGEVAANHPTLFTALAPRAPQVRQRPRRARAAADADATRHSARCTTARTSSSLAIRGCRRWPIRAARPCSTQQAPGALIGRTTEPFISVRTTHEITGQVGNVCFVEGLVQFKDRWLLYYGMGDSRIGVASAPAGAAARREGAAGDDVGRSAAPARVPLLGARPHARRGDAAHARAVRAQPLQQFPVNPRDAGAHLFRRVGVALALGRPVADRPAAARTCSPTWRACGRRGSTWRLACTRSSRRPAPRDRRAASPTPC